MESKVSRDIREALEITESKSRLFEEDNQDYATGVDDDDVTAVECPHCADVFAVVENNLYEDEDGDIVTICTLCENIVVLEDDGEEEGNDVIECPYCECVYEDSELLEDDEGYVGSECPECGSSFYLAEIKAGSGSSVSDKDWGARAADFAKKAKSSHRKGVAKHYGKKLGKGAAIGAGVAAAGYGAYKGIKALKDRKKKKTRNEDFDLSEMKKRVVRHGKKVTINVKSKKRRMTPKQKAALKKARRKSHTGKAKRSRKKSMRVAECMQEAYEADPRGYLSLMEDDTELTEIKKRVKGGKIVKKATAREHRVAARSFKMSSKRRAAMKKMQRKAHTGAAKRKRAKSKKRGKAAGLYK